MNLEPLYPYIITLAFIWLALLSFFIFRLISHYNSLTSGTKKTDLVSTLNSILKQLHDNQKDITSTNARLDQEIENAKKHFKCFGFKRFNPFTDTGGDQSFVLTLLDENHDGFVISSLHGRENTRVYAKRISLGKAPDQALSKEELEVINQAIKK
ncbi:MAG: hypothetical protein BWY29_00250 [Microgenomates group bacterium ADurb.Bin238]|nr:MAG: hypothetical protein BWY29_00250 [Microgenomates group bacterium ADurb.Bin238]